MTMLYSDVMSRSLTDEIDFTVKYLEIEKLRFKEKFEYHINVNENVEEFIEVPRMGLQAFAESALNNGLMHRSENGLLEINISTENNYIVFSITDNGGGIQKSKLLNKEKAFKSVKIIDEFFSILNSFNQTKITYNMRDLTENNVIKGTRVIVRIPTSLKYTF
jgi:sensor histidine kinase YesM